MTLYNFKLFGSNKKKRFFSNYFTTSRCMKILYNLVLICKNKTCNPTDTLKKKIPINFPRRNKFMRSILTWSVSTVAWRPSNSLSKGLNRSCITWFLSHMTSGLRTRPHRLFCSNNVVFSAVAISEQKIYVWVINEDVILKTDQTEWVYKLRGNTVPPFN